MNASSDFRSAGSNPSQKDEVYTRQVDDMQPNKSSSRLSMAINSSVEATLHSSPPAAEGDNASHSSDDPTILGKSEGHDSSPQSRRQKALMQNVKAITSMYKVGSLITPSNSSDEEAYQLDGVINWGRTGVVYRATRIVKGVVIEDRSFALKIMWFTQEGNPDEEEKRNSYRFQSLPVQSIGKAIRTDGRERARNELEALLSAQAIPHVIRLHQAFETPRHGVFVFEFVPGSVRMLINTFGGISEKDSRFYLRDILTALDDLHRIDEITSLVHGDVKPDNLLISDANEAILIDFGSAVRCPRKKALRNEGVSFVGSLPYTPPESVDFVVDHYLRQHDTDDKQLVNAVESRGKHFTTDMASQPSIDIWSFGVTTLDLLLGSCPFDVLCDDMGDAEQVLRIITDPLFLEALWESLAGVLSDDCLDFIKKCMDPLAAKRLTAQSLLEHSFLKDTTPKRPSSLRDVYIEHKLRRSTRGLFGGALTQRSSDTLSGVGCDLYRKTFERYTLLKEASRESLPVSRKRLSVLDFDRFRWIAKFVGSRTKTMDAETGTALSPQAVATETVKTDDCKGSPNMKLLAHMTSETLDETDETQPETDGDKSPDLAPSPITETARGWLRSSSTSSSRAPAVWRRWWRTQNRSASGPQEARDVLFFDESPKERDDNTVAPSPDHRLATSPPRLGTDDMTSKPGVGSEETMQSCITGHSSEYLSPSALSPHGIDGSVDIELHSEKPPEDPRPRDEYHWSSIPERRLEWKFMPLQFLGYLRGRQAKEDFEAVATGEVPRRHHLATMTDEDFALVESTYISEEEPKTD